MREKVSLFIAILFCFFITSISNAQDKSPRLFDRPYWDISLEYGIDAGLGGNFGYTNLAVSRGNFSHGGFSILYRDDGIDRWGEDYGSDIISRNTYPEDIEDSGYSYILVSGQAGLMITKGIHAIGTVEYLQATFVQKRFDDLKILSDSGKYYTEYIDKDRSGLGIGAGAKFFLPLSDKVAFTPMIIASTQRKLSFSLGLAF